MPTVRNRVTDQFPGMFVTLVSVLIGLVLADLLGEMHARMTLWPLTMETALTWAQVLAVGATALPTWITYSHIGMSRRTVASLPDTIIAFLTPVPLLVQTALAGRAESWPWFYGGGIYLMISFPTGVWLTRLALREPELAPFRRLLRPTGFLMVIYGGAAPFLLMGWLDQNGWLPQIVKILAAASVAPLALFCCHLFLRDWHIAVDEASAAASET